MTTNPIAPEEIHDESSSAPSNPVAKKVLIGVAIAAGLLFIGLLINLLNVAAASTHPYTGTGIVKSHAPWGSNQCNITVVEDNGGAEHEYSRMVGGLPYCGDVHDGDKIEIKDGVVRSVSAR